MFSAILCSPWPEMHLMSNYFMRSAAGSRTSAAGLNQSPDILSRVIVVGAGQLRSSTVTRALTFQNSMVPLWPKHTFMFPEPTTMRLQAIPRSRVLVTSCILSPHPKTRFLKEHNSSPDYRQRAGLGGTWNHDRLYPNLPSQNSYGMYENSDLPMTSAVGHDEGGSNNQSIVVCKINRYLHAWNEKWDLTKRMRFNWTVSLRVYNTRVIDSFKLRLSVDLPTKNENWK